MANKQTAHINRFAVAAKIRRGQPINEAELSVYLKVAYSVVRSWTWLPLLRSLLFFDDFVIARRMQLGLVADPRIGAHRRKSTAGKFG